MKNNLSSEIKANVFFRIILAAVCLFLVALPPVLAQQDASKVYEAVEKPAQPKGGMQGFQDYIGQALTYPTLSLRNKTEGTVVISFIVEKKGHVSNVEVVKGLDEACNKEAMRVIKESPKWEPARHKGQVVRQKMTIPLHFKIPSQLATAPAKADSSAKGSEFKKVNPEEPARPEGGTDAFFEYVQQNRKYPDKARKNKIEGKVMIEFMVEKDGSLTNLKVIKKLGNGLDEEAIRLIEKGPKWLPAQFNGQPIRQKMILPVIFQL